jgi:transcriptional regulator with XRE-family HTH domain
MNYYEIGQRIRKYRKAYRMSQSQLSEAVGISVTHLSHTGNTKLSLPVLVDIARVLEVRTDDLLFDKPSDKALTQQEWDDIVKVSTAEEARIIVDIAKATQLALEKYRRL